MGEAKREEPREDITVRKRAEEALQRAKREWESTFDAMHDWVSLIDAKTRRILRTNRVGEEIVGVPLKDMVGQTCCKLVHGTDEPIPGCPLKKMLDTHQREGAELQVPERDRWLMITVDPVIDKDEKLVGAVHIARDITQGKRIQEALRESEERFRSLFENSTIGLYRTTPDGRVLLANPTLVRMLGYSSFDELALRNLEEGGFEPDYPRSQFRERIEREGEVKGLEAAWRRRDGSVIFVRESAKAMQNAEGTVLYYEGTVEDITERKRAEEEVRRRSEESAALNEIAMAVTSTLDLQEVLQTIQERVVTLLGEKYPPVFGLFDEDNQTFEVVVTDTQKKLLERAGKLLGLRIQGLAFPLSTMNPALRQALLGQKPYMTSDASDILGPLVGRRLVQGTHRALGVKCIVDLPLWVKGKFVGGMVLLSQKKKIPDEEMELLSSIASQAAIAIENARLYGDLRTELAERKRAEEALRESDRRFRDIAENALEWIWEVDAIGKYTYASPVVEKILGYKPEEVLKKHFYDLFHPEDQEELKKAALEVFAKKESFREFINRNVHKNGKTVWLSTSGVPLLDEKGTLLGYRGADIDITERKRAEEEVQRHLDRLEALREIDRAISSTLDLSEVLDIILEQLERVIPYTSAAIFLLTDDIAKVTAARGFPDIERAMQVSFPAAEDPLTRQVLQERRPLVLTNAQADERFQARGGTEYVRSWMGVPLIARGEATGFLTIDHREPAVYDEDSGEMVLAFAGQAAIAIENARLYGDLRRELTERKQAEEALRSAALETLEAVSSIVEANDPYTAGHSARVTEIAIEIAKEMGLRDGEIDTLRIAGPLHDVGKVGISGSVLNKPTRLTHAEWVMIQSHPMVSAQTAERVAAFKDAVPIIRYHHERWDGTGYPDGLKGEEIPLLARVLAVADGSEAMTSDRPYRRALTWEEALAELEKGAGSQWDPQVVEAFLTTYESGIIS